MWDLWWIKRNLGQAFSEYFGFPCHSFHRVLHTHHYPSSGAGTRGQIVANVLNGLVSPHPKKLKKIPNFSGIPSPQVLSLATKPRTTSSYGGRIPSGFMINSNRIITQSFSDHKTTTATTILLLPQDIYVSMSESALNSTLYITVQ
jgi:hypothetical protein